jgi:hypothetical protein
MQRRYINNKADGRYSRMFEWLEMCPDLSPGAKLVYARLRRYASDKDGRGWIAYPRQSSLSEAVGIPERTCKSHIAELVKMGLLESVKRGTGKSNFYRFPVNKVMPGEGDDPTSEMPPADFDSGDIPY